LTKGISNVDISLQDQLVKVDATSATYEDVENAIKKTGKVITSGRIVEAAKPEGRNEVETSKVVA
jgi:copper chaperone CopZ